MTNPWRAHSNLNPQREDGNRQIESGVFRAITRADLTASEYKVFLVIVDKTWGYNKREDAISNGQFVVMTGLSSRMVRIAVKGLISRRIVIYGTSDVRVQQGSPIPLYMLNKYHDTWISKGCNRLQGCNTVSEKGAIQCHTRVKPVAPTKETITKETITKETHAELSERPRSKKQPGEPLDMAKLEIPLCLRLTDGFAELWAEWVAARAEAGQPLTHRAAQMQMRLMDDWGGDAARQSIKEAIAHGWRGLFKPKGKEWELRVEE